MLQKIYLSNKWFWTFCLWKNPEKKWFPQNYKAAQLHIRVISEGSCDTEDWSNDTEKFDLHHKNKLLK